MEKTRVIQEYVPGKQVTLCHILAHPNDEIYNKLGLIENTRSALGVLNVTPSETAIIAADLASKTADVSIGFVDRFSGSLLVVGEIGAIESAFKEVLRVFSTTLRYSVPKLTKT